MAANYGKHVSTRTTPQSESARADQKKNNAGGFVFTLDIWDRLDRWLILGAEGGTYYVTEKKLTKDNAKNVMACLAEDGIKTVNRIVEISEAGRAPKNEPAIFALAMASADENEATRKAALAALPRVCRIGTHLFHFARDVEGFRKWGRGLRNAVARWYTEKPIDKLAYDVVKYQQRDGWSHKDLLRLSHAEATSTPYEAIFRYVVAGTAAMGEREVKRRNKDKTERLVKYGATTDLPRIIEGFEKAKHETDPKIVAKLVTEYGLTREMVPTQSLNNLGVWEALLEKMPMTAMIRNLGKMTSIELLKPLSGQVQKVVSLLTNKDALRKARVHPMSLLVAMQTYAQGKGDKGSLKWEPQREIVDALDAAFYLSFETIEPTGKKVLLALDVSGSMSSPISSAPSVSCLVASAAMAMVTARAEQNWHAVGFSSGAPGEWYYGKGESRWGSGYRSGLTILNISPRQRLDDVVRTMQQVPMGGTDCSLPMLYALEKKIDVDVFHVYTDNETWAGSIQPFQALRNYRESTGKAAKLCVVGMSGTEFTIADPDDAGMLDVVGFDTAAPAVMADFARGKAAALAPASDAD